MLVFWARCFRFSPQSLRFSPQSRCVTFLHHKINVDLKHIYHTQVDWLFCELYMPLYFRQDHGFDPPCGPHQLPVFGLLYYSCYRNLYMCENVRHSATWQKSKMTGFNWLTQLANSVMCFSILSCLKLYRLVCVSFTALFLPLQHSLFCL